MNQEYQICRPTTAVRTATGGQADRRVSVLGSSGCFILGGAEGRMFRAKGLPSLGKGPAWQDDIHVMEDHVENP
jgi:hypothetical protein